MSSIASAITWLMNQVGYAICHQLPGRTLMYGGRALPVCARDTGIFLGFAVCTIALLVAYGVFPRGYPEWPRLLVVSLFVLPTVIDALTSYAGIRESTNAIRLVTGALAGTGLAAMVFPLAVTQLSLHLHPGTQDADPEPGRILASWWHVAMLLVVPAAVSLALWPEWPGAFWVWAPLVTLSIIFAFAVLNFTLVSLVWTGVRGSGPVPGPGVISMIALLAIVVEVIISNRLHWVLGRTT